MQVVAVEAQRRPVAETLSLVGTISANEMVEIKAETDGVVEEVLFEEGQHVEKGQLLMRLDDSKFAAGLAEAEANFKLSEANHARARQLLADKLISQQEFDQADATFDFNRAALNLRQRQLKDTRVHAPFEGVVGARNVSPGQVTSRNLTLTWLVDLDPVKVEVSVPERFLARTHVGQTIEFPVAAYAGRTFKGEIYFISPYVDETTRSAVVKARLPNPDYALKPGMLATLDVTLQVRDRAVVVPEAALAQVQDQDRAIVYAVNADLVIQPLKVTLGVRMPGQVEILTGLEGGERLVVEGHQKIGPGSKVVLAGPEAAAPYLRAGATNAPAPRGDQ
jgi:membrane fusion protein (multidrug efflux system)